MKMAASSLVKTAASSLIGGHQPLLGLLPPTSADNLLDKAEWNTGVTVQTAVPVGAPRERHDINSDFESDSASVD